MNIPRFFHPLAPLIKVLSLCSVVFLSVFAINHFHLSKQFPIKSVRIYGANHFDHRYVQDLVTPFLKKGFFGVDVDYIRDRLLQQPWAADVSVRRHWPERIEILVVEKHPIARWDKHTLLSDNGELFTPNEAAIPDHLPVFEGPTGEHIMMLTYFNEMNRLLNPLHAKIDYLALTPYMTWKVRLNNGITLQIGHKDVLTRLNHFVKVYSKIIGDKAADVDSIDLRYPNGVAVRWKMPVST